MYDKGIIDEDKNSDGNFYWEDDEDYEDESFHHPNCHARRTKFNPYEFFEYVFNQRRGKARFPGFGGFGFGGLRDEIPRDQPPKIPRAPRCEEIDGIVRVSWSTIFHSKEYKIFAKPGRLGIHFYVKNIYHFQITNIKKKMYQPLA